jgi:hypothetical protein
MLAVRAGAGEQEQITSFENAAKSLKRLLVAAVPV